MEADKKREQENMEADKKEKAEADKVASEAAKKLQEQQKQRGRGEEETSRCKGCEGSAEGRQVCGRQG